MHKAKAESAKRSCAFGRKALSVALSAILLGFGWPMVNPSVCFAADEDAQNQGAEIVSESALDQGSNEQGSAASDSSVAGEDVYDQGEQGVSLASDGASTRKATSVSVGIGALLTIEGTTIGSNHSWVSSDEGVATIAGSNGGTTASVEGKKAGVAKITHTYYTSKHVSWTQEFEVTVEEFKVTGADSVKQFESTKFSVNASSVAWSSSDEEIATVDSEGNVKGIAKGAVTITAAVSNGDKKLTASKQVVVNEDNNSNVEKVSFYFALPGIDLSSNNTKDWYPDSDLIGRSDYIGKVNTKGMKLGDTGGYTDNVKNRVVEWPSNMEVEQTADGFELVKDGSAGSLWNALAAKYNVEAEDVYKIILTPHKITVTPLLRHLDCAVDVIAKKSIVPSDDNEMSITLDKEVVYDGEEHKLVPTVKDGEKTLKADVDYTVSYTDASGAAATDFANVTSEIKVIVNGIGKYKDSAELSYKITPKSLKATDVSVSQPSDATFDGMEHKFVPVVKDGEKELKADEDYAVFYTNAAGEAVTDFTNAIDGIVVTVKGEGNYKDAVELNYKISQKSLEASSLSATLPASEVVYDGEEHKLVPTVKDGEKTLKADVDYIVSYARVADEVAGRADVDFTNVTNGIAVTVGGKGNYQGTLKLTYIITPKPIKVVTASGEKVYDGTPLIGADLAGNSVEGLVDSADATLKVTGSQLEVGSSDNVFELAFAAGMEANYKLSNAELGTLTVTEPAVEPGQKPSDDKNDSSTKGDAAAKGNPAAKGQPTQGKAASQGQFAQTGDAVSTVLPIALAFAFAAAICAAFAVGRRFDL